MPPASTAFVSCRASEHPSPVLRRGSLKWALVLALFCAVSVLPVGTRAALAFSQITGENGETPPPREDGIVSVPLPPVSNGDAPDAEPDARPTPEASSGGPAESSVDPSGDPSAGDSAPVFGPFPEGAGDNAPRPDDASTGDPAAAAEGADDPAEPPAVVRYGDADLPQPVRDLRNRLIAIAKTGDIESLRPYLETGTEPTVVSNVNEAPDPVAFLKTASGDGEGVEVLAILLELLQGGYVHLDSDGDEEIYEWPYFTEVALSKLTKPQLVELFEIVTAGDYERMKDNGAYDFYRVGISPDGRLQFLVAGD